MHKRYSSWEGNRIQSQEKEYRVSRYSTEKTVITCIIFLNYLYHMHIDIDKIHVVDAVVGSNWCTSY